jgi:uncharacterized membrane protein YgcG
MRCPVCQQSLHEVSPACPQCSFDLSVAVQHLGMVPRLQPDVTDLASALSPGQAAALQELIRTKERRFPQVRFAFVTLQLPAQVPLRAYTFWLLNRGSLVSPMEKGGDCRLVLFVLEMNQLQMCCMLGYGLEPFISQSALEEIVHAARPLLAKGDAAGAFQACLEQADQTLVAISRAIPTVFGLHQEKIDAPLSTEAEFAY